MQENQRASQSQAQAQSQPQQPIYLQAPQGIALEDLIDSRPTAPERYDDNQSRYLAFKRQAKDHLELRRATVRTDADKCRTVGSLLISDASQWYLSLCEQEPEALLDIDLFWTRADAHFMDPFRRQTVREQLMRL
ncbi:hypothetical protein SeMB42_g07128 [Synchytrium endobioticum]|uniref:Uncharacterized protein n=1 Tax=Synchytrium endobioticum TaxID=286115 RepID=A0A507CDC3_9FUNG|nr:hypothetical protein SeMB42_g07128 [Synchytrium endobioticum]